MATKGKHVDNRENRMAVRAWMRANHRSYDNSTQLSEACADALDMYEELTFYKIPEHIFEIATDYIKGE